MDHSTEQISRIREIARKRLMRLCNCDRHPTEAFVFKNDLFCGLRFRQGMFCAQWMVGDEQIEIFREQMLVERLPMQDTEKRAA